MSELQVAVSGIEKGPATVGLKGSLGVASIVLMVVAQAAPLTVMVANTPLLISMGNGAAAPFDALIAMVIMFLFTVGFVAMSKHIANAGAFYAYIQKGMGRIFGLGAATMATLSYFFILVALEAYIGYAVGDLLANFLNIHIPWWVLSLGIVGVVGFFGYRDIELSSKFLGIALILEIAIVLLVDLVIFMHHGVAGMDLTPFSGEVLKSGSPGLGILFAIFSFAGFEATVIYREEARDPERTIPRATYTAVFVIGVFYVVSMWFEVVGVGAKNVVKLATDHPGDMYLLLAKNYLGTVLHDVMQVLLVTSLFACVLALHNVVARYQYVLGRYGVLHNKLSEVHDRHGSPHVSSWVQTVSSVIFLIVLIVIGLDPVTQIYAWGATAGTLGYMIILSLTCTSIIVFFRRNRDDSRLWNTCIAPCGGLVGMLACLWIAFANLPGLIGGNSAQLIAYVMSLIVVLSFAIGLFAAMVLKHRYPTRFEKLRELA